MSQTLGETREAMGWDVMKQLEKLIDEHKDIKEPYWIVFHIKPMQASLVRIMLAQGGQDVSEVPDHELPQIIRNKPVIMRQKPPKLLASMVFEVNNETGVLKLCWALPPDLPQVDNIDECYPDENIVIDTLEAAKGINIRY